MSKADTLLKKAVFFERMAIYSDRRTFLQALAQETAPDPNKELIGKALQILQSAGVDEAATQPLGNAVTFNKVDLPAIKKAIQDAILTGKLNPLAHGPQIQQLRQISNQLQSAEKREVQQGMAGPADYTFDKPTDKITGFKPIDSKDQEAVFNFAIQQGELLPDPDKQNPDGKIGPETRKALEGVKNYFAKQNPQNPRMTDQQAINAAKFKGR